MNYQDYVNQRLAQGVDFSIGTTISRGFSLMGKHVGSYIGYFIVFIVIAMVSSLVAGVIPFVGTYIVGIAISPPLIMGFAIYCRKSETGANPEFSNFFDGFKTNYGQLVLVNLIIQLALGLLSLGLILPYLKEFAVIVQDLAVDPSLIDSVFEEIFAKFIANWWMFVIYILIAVTVQILYALANYFVIFYDYGFWEAMEASRQLMSKVFFKTILLGIVLYFILGLGIVITLGFGMLFFVPAAVLMGYSLFEQVAGFESTEAQIEDDLII